MAKLRYTEQCDIVAYKAIAVGGTDRAAYESLGISATTFYSWMSRYSGFRDAVERARDFNQRSSPEALKLALVAYIVQALENGGEIVRSEQTIRTRTTQRDRNNRIVFVTDEEKTIEIQEQRGLPKWIADKILANASSLNDAIAKVLNAGYEVSEPTDNLLSGSSENNYN